MTATLPRGHAGLTEPQCTLLRRLTDGRALACSALTGPLPSRRPALAALLGAGLVEELVPMTLEGRPARSGALYRVTAAGLMALEAAGRGHGEHGGDLGG